MVHSDISMSKPLPEIKEIRARATPGKASIVNETWKSPLAPCLRRVTPLEGQNRGFAHAEHNPLPFYDRFRCRAFGQPILEAHKISPEPGWRGRNTLSVFVL